MKKIESVMLKESAKSESHLGVNGPSPDSSTLSRCNRQFSAKIGLVRIRIRIRIVYW